MLRVHVISSYWLLVMGYGRIVNRVRRLLMCWLVRNSLRRRITRWLWNRWWINWWQGMRSSSWGRIIWLCCLWSFWEGVVRKGIRRRRRSSESVKWIEVMGIFICAEGGNWTTSMICSLNLYYVPIICYINKMNFKYTCYN